MKYPNFLTNQTCTKEVRGNVSCQYVTHFWVRASKPSNTRQDLIRATCVRVQSSKNVWPSVVRWSDVRCKLSNDQMIKWSSVRWSNGQTAGRRMLSRWTVSWQLSQNVWMSCNRCHPERQLALHTYRCLLYNDIGFTYSCTLFKRLLYTDIGFTYSCILYTDIVYTGVGVGQLATQLISDLCARRTSWSSSIEFTNQ